MAITKTQKSRFNLLIKFMFMLPHVYRIILIRVGLTLDHEHIITNLNDLICP